MMLSVAVLYLQQWRCHKIVRAGRIVEIDTTLQWTMAGKSYYRVRVEVVADPTSNELSGSWWFDGQPTWFADGVTKAPKVGDYFVVYDDEYVSWSPAAAFDNGYTKHLPCVDGGVQERDHTGLVEELSQALDEDALVLGRGAVTLGETIDELRAAMDDLNHIATKLKNFPGVHVFFSVPDQKRVEAQVKFVTEKAITP